MIASRFTKVFQLIALALMFSVAQVYVLGAPTGTGTDPKAKEPASASHAGSETIVADSSVNRAATTISAESQLLTPEAAAERMPLTAGSKTLFNRIFSKRDMQARIATGNTFLKAQANFKDTFKSPSKSFASPQMDTDDDDDDNGGRKGMWIAIGVVAAVLVISVIALQHDRDITSVQE